MMSAVRDRDVSSWKVSGLLAFLLAGVALSLAADRWGGGLDRAHLSVVAMFALLSLFSLLDMIIGLVQERGAAKSLSRMGKIIYDQENAGLSSTFSEPLNIGD